MKKLLLMVMLAGFGMSSIAQDKVKCKAGTSKKTVKSQRVVAKKQALKPVSMAQTRVAAPVPAPCTSYRKNNIVVTECPGLMFDQNDRLEASSYRSYSGYLPLNADTITLPDKGDASVSPFRAPQHNVINRKGGAAPAGGNFCVNNCSSQ